MYKKIIVVLSISLLISSCDNSTNNQKQEKPKTVTEKQPLGFVYTTTNGEGNNIVVQLSRYADGTLGDEKTYDTGVKGGSDHSAPAHGDYDAQGATKIVGNCLLTCNTGDNSIAVFHVDKKTGNLHFVANTPSHGTRPVTLGWSPVAGSESEFWVAVGNQWNTPTVIYDGDKLQRLPSDAFFKQDLAKPDVTDKERNTQLFKLNTNTGELKYQGLISEYNRQNGGPCDVKFSPDGKKIAVTLWGVPHFLTEKPILKETRPSRTYIYDFDNGKISNPRYFEEEGIVGSVGFNWSQNSDMLYVSNFNLIPEKIDQGLMILKDEGTKLIKVKTFVTGIDGKVDEACWTAVSPDNKRLYVCSFATNVLGSYEIDDNGMVTKNINFEKRGDNAPLEDSKDIYVTPDNKYVYFLGSLTSFSINRFDITNEGVKYKSQYNVQATKDKIGQTGVYDLGGLDGFDIQN